MAGYSLAEWQDAQNNIRDLERVRRLGFKMYQAFSGSPQVPNPQWAMDLIAAFARLLDLAFKGMDRNIRRQLRRHMQGHGKFREPNLLEGIAHRVAAHELLNNNIALGGRPTLFELLLMAQDLEANVRPNLRRLLWLARLSDGKTRIPYPQSQLTAQGEQASLGRTLDKLKEWVRSPGSKVLTKTERSALRRLMLSFKSSAPNQIDLDGLRNWVFHRDFVIYPRHVEFHLHRREGDRKLMRMVKTRREVTDMRLELVGLVSLILTFEGMFRFYEATPARAYRRRPQQILGTPGPTARP